MKILFAMLAAGILMSFATPHPCRAKEPATAAAVLNSHAMSVAPAFVASVYSLRTPSVAVVKRMAPKTARTMANDARSRYGAKLRPRAGWRGTLGKCAGPDTTVKPFPPPGWPTRSIFFKVKMSTGLAARITTRQ